MHTLFVCLSGEWGAEGVAGQEGLRFPKRERHLSPGAKVQSSCRPTTPQGQAQPPGGPPPCARPVPHSSPNPPSSKPQQGCRGCAASLLWASVSLNPASSPCVDHSVRESAWQRSRGRRRGRDARALVEDRPERNGKLMVTEDARNTPGYRRRGRAHTRESAQWWQVGCQVSVDAGLWEP